MTNIVVLDVRRVGGGTVIASARVQIGALVIDGIALTQWPPGESAACVHLPEIETVDDHVAVEIADAKAMTALTRELLITAHHMHPEEGQT
jgi:hypothetical protein